MLDEGNRPWRLVAAYAGKAVEGTRSSGRWIASFYPWKIESHCEKRPDLSAVGQGRRNCGLIQLRIRSWLRTIYP
ncbi:protein of unknown function [Cyanobium sp. NIES-981]|nr:protein of unknown function [Cyanobium sp. NIES-981]